MAELTKRLKLKWETLRQKTGRKPLPVEGGLEDPSKRLAGWNRKQVRIGRKIYPSLAEASRQTGMTASSLRRRLNKERYPDYEYVDET